MNSIVCPYCGGINPFYDENNKYFICDYCDNKFYPKTVDSEKIKQMKERANRLFLCCDFDGASNMYRNITIEDPKNHEAYWFLTLCSYGIQYVTDPLTKKKIPTCNRTQYFSIFDTDDYKKAIENADVISRETYEKSAKKIDSIQKGILEIVEKEPPYDIFICYKEKELYDINKRTKESEKAQELYYKLDKEGYKTFYAPITLQEKAGREYEPFIFAALNSAKIMVVIGFSRNNFNATWVKNEWSRFLVRKSKNPNLIIISCFHSFLMDAAELPPELSKTQAKDLANASINDLVGDIKKLLPKNDFKVNNTANFNVSAKVMRNEDAAAMAQRGYLFLEDLKFAEAKQYFDKCLDKNPEFSKAYWGLLLCNYKCVNNEDLVKTGKSIKDVNEYKKAIRFASGAEQDTFVETSNRIEEKINNTVKLLDKTKRERVLSSGAMPYAESGAYKINLVNKTFNEKYDALVLIEKQISEYKIAFEKEMAPYIEIIKQRQDAIINALKFIKDRVYCDDKTYQKSKAEVEEHKRIITEQSNMAGNVKEASSNLKKAKELLEKQKELIQSINNDITSMKGLEYRMGEYITKANKIIKEFDDAAYDVKKGDYKASTALLREV